MRRLPSLIGILLILLAMSACDALPVLRGEPPSAPASAPTATPELTEPADAPGDTAAPAPTAEPSAPLPTAPAQPPAMAAWPLAADLFVLNDAGQVWRQPRSGDESAATAVTPLDASVADFAVAPGGSWLATRTVESIVVGPADGSAGQVIAQGVSLPGDAAAGGFGRHTLAWSPDADKLAYVTETGFTLAMPGAGQDFEGMLFPVAEAPLSGLSWAPGSDWLFAARVDGSGALYQVEPLQQWVDFGPINGHTWLSDGRLAFAPGAGGMAVVTPGEPDSRQFIVPQDRQVTLPVQRADGMVAFFSHSGSVGEPGFLHAADPVELSFRVESSVPVQTKSAVWEPGGGRLLTEGEAPETLTVLDPLTGARAEIGAPGAARRVGWGGKPARSVSGLTLPADLYFLAPVEGVVQVWRLPASGDPPQALTTAPEHVRSFDISPDGARVLYDSGGAIWEAPARGGEAQRILNLNAQATAPAAMPAYSPDGEWIAYANAGLWINNLETGILRQVMVDRNTGSGNTRREVYDQPRWSPDGGWLLGRATFYEGTDTVLVPLGGEPGNRGDPVFLNLYGARTEWLEDGRIIALYAGGTYGAPTVSLVQPGEAPAVTRLLDLPARDARLGPAGRLVLLRVPLPGVGLPPTVRVVSVAPGGDDFRAETGTLAVEQAVLSPDTSLIAGLRDLHADTPGMEFGQLVVVDAGTGQEFAINGAGAARSLRWEP